MKPETAVSAVGLTKLHLISVMISRPSTPMESLATSGDQLPLNTSSSSPSRRLNVPDDPIFTEDERPRSSRSTVIEEDFGEQLHEAQEQLLELRHRQQELEKQKDELEELRVRQDKFLKGRVEVVEKLNRCLTRLDRETFQVRKRAEQLDHAKESFNRHLDIIDNLTPENWSRANLRDELLKATSALDDAELDYEGVIARLSLSKESTKADPDDTSTPASPLSRGDFNAWLKAGFAFTLPLVLAGIALIALNWLLNA